MKYIRTYSLLFLLIVGCGFLSACSTTAPDPLTPTGSQLDGTHWLLRKIYRAVLPDIEIEDSALTHYTLTFGVNNVVSGIGDCNNFSGTYARGYQDTLYLTNLLTTEIGCPDEASEIAYFKGLSTAVEYALDTDELALHCASSDIVFMYFYRY